jgi:hypothetical protein
MVLFTSKRQFLRGLGRVRPVDVGVELFGVNELKIKNLAASSMRGRELKILRPSESVSPSQSTPML